jgi:hypothetical protein
LDVLLWALLGSTAQQQNQSFAVFAETDAVAGAKIELVFERSRANTFHAREVSIRHPYHGIFAAAFRGLNQSA